MTYLENMPLISQAIEQLLRQGNHWSISFNTDGFGQSKEISVGACTWNGIFQ